MSRKTHAYRTQKSLKVPIDVIIIAGGKINQDRNWFDRNKRPEKIVKESELFNIGELQSKAKQSEAKQNGGGITINNYNSQWSEPSVTLWESKKASKQVFSSHNQDHHTRPPKCWLAMFLH
ncbi:hypothetical protein EYR41_012109 [Orbilia oligospora]|uniref:Uncharacterized protein n=1 Tax=Orbilia oligospora TaxID=2813651 RepID=A0A8H2HQF0_ORBOL|nr:hypothetical protein EYR41_012109 [Orbilia oligospora]